MFVCLQVAKRAVVSMKEACLSRALSRVCYRWVLIGPKRSGTSVHVDPLGTSTWNTVLSGRKLWVVSPPGTLKALRGHTGDEVEMEEKDYHSTTRAIDYFVDMLPGIIRSGRVLEEHVLILWRLVTYESLVANPGAVTSWLNQWNCKVCVEPYCRRALN